MAKDNKSQLLSRLIIKTGGKVIASAGVMAMKAAETLRTLGGGLSIDF